MMPSSGTHACRVSLGQTSGGWGVPRKSHRKRCALPPPAEVRDSHSATPAAFNHPIFPPACVPTPSVWQRRSQRSV